MRLGKQKLFACGRDMPEFQLRFSLEEFQGFGVCAAKNDSDIAQNLRWRFDGFPEASRFDRLAACSLRRRIDRNERRPLCSICQTEYKVRRERFRTTADLFEKICPLPELGGSTLCRFWRTVGKATIRTGYRSR